VLIYGKLLLGIAAYLGLLRARRTLFCYPRGTPLFPGSRFEVLAPTGNQTADYLQFATRLGVPLRRSRIQINHTLKNQLELAVRPQINGPSYVVVAPWASDVRRGAPLQFFRGCIEVIVKEARLPVVITGMPRNRADAATLVKGFSSEFVSDLTGDTSPRQMLGLLGGARFLLANDSGNLHLARLVGTKALITFGPTAPEQRLLEGTWHGLVPLWRHLRCSPCHDSRHRYQCPDAYLDCLRGLTTVDVRNALLGACGILEASALPGLQK
jgi:ADP-heptose:LPS heptosyltransferase